MSSVDDVLGQAAAEGMLASRGAPGRSAAGAAWAVPGDRAQQLSVAVGRQAAPQQREGAAHLLRAEAAAEQCPPDDRQIRGVAVRVQR